MVLRTRDELEQAGQSSQVGKLSALEKCTEIWIIRGNLFEVDQECIFWFILGILKRLNSKKAKKVKIQWNSNCQHGPKQDWQAVLFESRAEKSIGHEASDLQYEANEFSFLLKRVDEVLHPQEKRGDFVEDAAETSEIDKTVEVGCKINKWVVFPRAVRKSDSAQTIKRIQEREIVQRAEQENRGRN